MDRRGGQGVTDPKSPPSIRDIARDVASNQTAVFLLIASLTFLSRLPFLDAGYGDNDAWRVAQAARDIATHGEYVASRLPGYPLQEVVSALFWSYGPVGLNALSAAASAIAVAFFALILQRIKAPWPTLGAAALAFVPIVYDVSTMALSDVWALAGLLAAFYFALGGKSRCAGIALGLAAGSRLTTAAALIPLIVVLWGDMQSRKLRLANLVGAAVLVGIVLYLPVFARYGTGFLHFTEDPNPSISAIGSRTTVGVWGLLGCFGLLGAFVAAVVVPRSTVRRAAEAAREPSQWFLGAVLMIGAFALIYARLPEQARYLVPIVPFVILVMSRLLSRRIYAAVCCSLVVASFVSFDLNGAKPGRFLTAYHDRGQRLESAIRIVRRTEQLGLRAVVIAGHWLPVVSVLKQEEAHLGGASLVYLLSGQDLGRLNAEGVPIYVIADQRSFNIETYGVDPVGAISISPVDGSLEP
jgi:hypothetical protein